MRGAKKDRRWASGDGRVFSAEEEKHLTCGDDGQKEVVGKKTKDRLWVEILKGLNQNQRVSMMKETYLQIILPRDLL